MQYRTEVTVTLHPQITNGSRFIYAYMERILFKSQFYSCTLESVGNVKQQG